MMGKGDIKDKCANDYEIPPYGQKGYADPEKYKRDLYEQFGVNEPISPTEFLQ